MAGSKDAWNEVSERFAQWGHHLAERYKESGGATGDTAQETQHKLEAAAREITDALDRAFNALGETLRDDSAKSELKDAVRSIGDAVGTTVSETGDVIRRRMSSSGKGPGEGSETDDEAPGPDHPAA